MDGRPAADPNAAAPPSNARDSAFASVALPHLPAIARMARVLTGNQADADDLVQETFLRAYRSWHTFLPGADARRWLAAICRHTFFELRHRERHSDAVDGDELESLAASRLHEQARSAGLDDMYSRLDLAPAIGRAIDDLDPAFRQVVVLGDVEGFTYQEIAEMLGIPIGTVRSRLYRARRQLQESLMAYAIDAGFGVSSNRGG